MIDPGRLLVRDVASMLLDIVPDAPCNDDTFACSLRAVVDYTVPVAVALGVCVAIGFFLAISVSVVLASSERRRGPVRIRKRVLSGPVRTDGRWIRLVEDERGRRRRQVGKLGDERIVARQPDPGVIRAFVSHDVPRPQCNVVRGTSGR